MLYFWPVQPVMEKKLDTAEWTVSLCFPRASQQSSNPPSLILHNWPVSIMSSADSRCSKTHTCAHSTHSPAGQMLISLLSRTGKYIRLPFCTSQCSVCVCSHYLKLQTLDWMKWKEERCVCGVFREWRVVVSRHALMICFLTCQIWWERRRGKLRGEFDLLTRTHTPHTHTSLFCYPCEDLLLI